jgi:hypothetical protein
VITIVSTCKNRLAHLQQSLPSWLEHTDCKVLVVDYHDPEGAADWVESIGSDRARAVRFPAPPRQYFNKPEALNYGIAQVDTPYTFLLDADVVADSRLRIPLVSGDRFVVAKTSRRTRDLTGLLLAPTQELRKVPFDPTITGWGAEDLDVRIRLATRLKYDVYPFTGLTSIEHSDALRTACYQVKSIRMNFARNMLRLLTKPGFPFTKLPALVASGLLPMRIR